MPSETERASIASRVDQLERELAPATPDQITEIAAMLFVSTPQASVSAQVMNARYDVFCEALSDLPAWAIRNAAMKWIRGEAPGNPAFAPSAGELSRIALEETRQHHATIAKLRRVLMARAISKIEHTPEAKQRVAKLAGDFARSISDNARREAP